MTTFLSIQIDKIRHKSVCFLKSFQGNTSMLWRMCVSSQLPLCAPPHPTVPLLARQPWNSSAHFQFRCTWNHTPPSYNGNVSGDLTQQVCRDPCLAIFPSLLREPGSWCSVPLALTPMKHKHMHSLPHAAGQLTHFHLHDSPWHGQTKWVLHSAPLHGCGNWELRG